MKKQLMKRVVSCFVVCVMLATCYSGVAMAKWNVKPSTVDYFVQMNNSNDVFICNKETVGTKVGTEYYMTYTVESLDEENTVISNMGLVGTNVPGNTYPYVTTEDGKGGGYYIYDDQNKLLVEGNTYFIKFTITEDGYSYRASWAREDKSRYLKFDLDTAGEVKTNLGYFGVWFGCSGISGKLTKLRIYDKSGNDLGVQITPGRNAEVGREKSFPKDTEVDHTYDIIIKDQSDVAISNKRVPTSDTVYMEYKVQSAKGTHAYQTGLILSNSPTAGYPYLDGFMYYNTGLDPTIEQDVTKVDGGPLLEPGAEYLIIFEKKADQLDVTAQKTVNGKSTYLTFEWTYGTYSQSANYFTLWFGEGEKFRVNTILTNFKCYDSNKNNLGIQTNRDSEIIHYGQLEDYAGCEAMYVCKSDNTLYALYEDQTLKYTENKTTQKGTYRVEESILTVNIEKQKKEYDFMYQYFKGKDKKVYRRLQSYKLKFDTGKGSKVEEQILNADNGYMPMRPADPTLENNVFGGWFTSNGEEYNFDSIVTESITLYAKWLDTEYVNANEKDVLDVMPYISIGVAVAILVACGAIGVRIMTKARRKKDGNNC